MLSRCVQIIDSQDLRMAHEIFRMRGVDFA